MFLCCILKRFECFYFSLDSVGRIVYEFIVVDGRFQCANAIKQITLCVCKFIFTQTPNPNESEMCEMFYKFLLLFVWIGVVVCVNVHVSL